MLFYFEKLAQGTHGLIGLLLSTTAYKKNTDKEKLYIWAADNFNRQIRQRYPTLRPMCLVAKNEFGAR